MPAYGSLVIVSTPRGKRYLRRVEEGQDWHSGDGILSMADVAAADFGSEVKTSLDVPFRLLEPTLYYLVRGVKG